MITKSGYVRTDAEMALLRGTPPEVPLLDEDAELNQAANKRLAHVLRDLEAGNQAVKSAVRVHVTDAFLAISPSGFHIPNSQLTSANTPSQMAIRRPMTRGSEAVQSPSPVPASSSVGCDRRFVLTPSTAARAPRSPLPPPISSLAGHRPPTRQQRTAPAPRVDSSNSAPLHQESVLRNSERELLCTEFENWVSPMKSVKDTGYASLARWGEVCFEEAKVAVGGDDAIAAAGNKPIRLLTSVCLMVLDHAMENSAEFTDLWKKMRDEVFVAVFSNYQRVCMPEPVVLVGCEQQLPEAYTAAQHRAHFARAPMWYETAEGIGAELKNSKDILAAQRSMNAKFVTLSDLTSAHSNRKELHCAFFSWRAVTRQQVMRRKAVETYLVRQNAAKDLTSSFLRWRRYTLVGRSRKLSGRVDDARKQQASREHELTAEMSDLKFRYQTDVKTLELELVQERELKKTIVEGHLVETHEFQQTQRAKEEEMAKVKRDRHRWECTAKMFRPEGLTQPFPALLIEGAALKQIEDELAFPGATVSSSQAREQLDKFLLTWANLELSAVGLKALQISNLRLDVANGVFFINLFQVLRPLREQARSKFSNTEWLQSFVNLMWINSAGGLFPPLLTHCPYYRSFFTTEDYLYNCSPTAPTWILATLFVARALRTAYEKSSPQLSQAVDTQVDADLLLGDSVIRDKTGERKSNKKAAVRRKTASVSLPINPARRSITSNSSRKSLVFAPLRSQSLGDSPSLSSACDLEGVEATLADMFADDSSSGGAAAETASSSSLPSVPPELKKMALLDFINFLASNNDCKEQWVGLARVVTSLILRHRCLDQEDHTVSRKSRGGGKAPDLGSQPPPPTAELESERTLPLIGS